MHNATSRYRIYAYIYLTDETSGNTKYEITIPVEPRPKPTSPTEDPEVDSDLFRETVAAVQRQADRAEKSVTEIKKVSDSLSGHIEQAEELDGTLSGKIEQGEDIVANIKDKLDSPPNPLVGRYLRVKAVNDEGIPELEWVEAPSGGSDLDVRINGESIVKDGVANITIAGNGKDYGVVKVGSIWYDGLALADDGSLQVAKTSIGHINVRYPHNSGAIMASNLDYAVKAAMCDGKGPAWTSEEQANARKRMGVIDAQDMADITEITMDAETLKYIFPSFADYRVLEISFFKTYKAATGISGNVWLKLSDAVGWLAALTHANNRFTLNTFGKSCIGRYEYTNNDLLPMTINGLMIKKDYWNTEFREAPYFLLPNAEWAQYYAECNTVIKVRGIKR